MKFTIIERKGNYKSSEEIDEISSDEEDTPVRSKHIVSSRHRLIESRPALKPLIIKAPPLPPPQPITFRPNPQHIFLISDSQSSAQDLYVLPPPQPPTTQIKPSPPPPPSPKTQTCTICLQDISPPAAKIPCGHTFCGDCIIQSSKVSNKCPNCRASYKKVTIGSKIIKVKNKTMDEQEFDFDYDDEPCYVCGLNDNGEELLICDHCEFAFCHVRCDRRLNGRFPTEEWYCEDCSLHRRQNGRA